MTIGRVTAFSAVVLIVMLGNALASDLPTISNGLPYRVARIYLLTKGNRPVPQQSRSEDACTGGEDVCRTYPETLYCSGTGERGCAFVWRTPSGVNFSVGTVGEQLRDIEVRAVQVLPLNKKEW
jgi:hypothetical protein